MFPKIFEPIVQSLICVRRQGEQGDLGELSTSSWSALQGLSRRCLSCCGGVEVPQALPLKERLGFNSGIKTLDKWKMKKTGSCLRKLKNSTCGYVYNHHVRCGVGGQTTVVAWKGKKLTFTNLTSTEFTWIPQTQSSYFELALKKKNWSESTHVFFSNHESTIAFYPEIKGIDGWDK